jgi:hypothetical protein
VNLVGGERIGAKECRAVLDTLRDRLLETQQKGRLSPELVIEACGRLVENLDEERYLAAMAGTGIDRKKGEEYLREVKIIFSRDYLRMRLKTELGEDFPAERRYIPYAGEAEVCERILPLGVLLHIAAGNADGLPAFSVLEGLLAGNINLLKLPELDGGVTADLLAELIKIEPRLAGYVYVFDYSSQDEKSVSKLIEAADAVVVWGGDTAVKALRRMVGPDTRLIEWGHKIGFAFVTESGVNDNALYGLARNICRTDQLLCNSCQGIFLDTEDSEAVFRFCERFLPILEDVSKDTWPHGGIGVLSQVTLELYNEDLESLYNGSRIYRGKNCGIIAYQDSGLNVSIQFRNPWVKRLPREKLLGNLRPHKNHLQTAALLCGEDERPALVDLLSQTGLTRITGGGNMSDAYCGAAHDGEYPLRRYTKIFSVE